MKKILACVLALLLLLEVGVGTNAYATEKAAAASERAVSLSSKGYLWPITGKIFARGFANGHYGVDIAAAKGTEVQATAAGTVICSSMASASDTATCSTCKFEGAGYHVVVEHADGIHAVYAHLSKTSVSKGAKVTAGQKVGEVGDTGVATGNHLHFALFKGGHANANALDPMEYTSPFSNIYATDITNNSATLYGILGNAGMSMVSGGFYIGTSPNNMTKITETMNTDGYISGVAIKDIFYGTAKWYKTLQPGTTYYYKMWVNYYGKELVSVVKSFTTTGTHTHSYTSVVTAATCTAGGYTTYTCSTCGNSYQDNLTDPKGHSYVSGSCGVCGEEDPDYVKIVVPTLTLKAPTLEFKDMITVNAMFTAENIDDVVEMGMITYSSQVDEWNVETAEYVIPGTTYDESTGRYIATSQGIHAKYLGDAVYLACYAKLTDGSYVYTKLASYSPVQYATSKLKGTDTALKQLVVAMLNYGAAAQTHFGHNVENLANATLSAEQIALPESYRSDMVSTVASPDADKQGAFVNNKGFAKRYPSISFEGAFCINYFFTPNYAPVNGITLYYWSAADYEAASVLTPANATGSIKMEGSGTGEYRGDITGIAAKALGEGVYVAAVYSSDGITTWTSGVLGYSIGAYCASQSTKGGTIADLAMATAVYGYQAKQYFN